MKPLAMDVFVFDPVVHTLVLTMNAAPRWITFSAGLLGFTGVTLGALGAHFLKERLTTGGTLAIWQTAVLYHLVHSVALLALPGWSGIGAQVRWIARSWVAGIILFSGSLYWLALDGPKFLGPVTPIGGLALLAGWLLVAFSAGPSPKP